MRLYLKLSKNTQSVPYNCHSKLVGTFHKWLGAANKEHDEISLYSFSGLKGGKGDSNGLNFRNGADWFIGAHDLDFLKRLAKGILKMPDVAYGMQVKELEIVDYPEFEHMAYFHQGSPIFIKRTLDDGSQKHYTYLDHESDSLLTETLQNKLKIAGLSPDGVKVQFDKTFPKANTTILNYRGINNRTSLCPVIITGSQEQIGFAWDVGVGNSTGIGLGSLI
jgi:CRISPR-associated endoribonuclease Cas6